MLQELHSRNQTQEASSEPGPQLDYEILNLKLMPCLVETLRVLGKVPCQVSVSGMWEGHESLGG